MNRQRAVQSCISSLHIQQGLFALLALLITLVAGQQFLRWEQSQQQAAPQRWPHYSTQTHFSAVSSQAADSVPTRLIAVDQVQPVVDMPRQERWLF